MIKLRRLKYMALLQLVPWFDEAELQQIAALFFPAVGLSEDEAVKSKERGVAIVSWDEIYVRI